jgi:hypothetical protein
MTAPLADAWARPSDVSIHPYTIRKIRAVISSEIPTRRDTSPDQSGWTTVGTCAMQTQPSSLGEEFYGYFIRLALGRPGRF